MFASSAAIISQPTGAGTTVDISPSALSLPPTRSVDLTYLVERAVREASIASEGVNRGR